MIFLNNSNIKKVIRSFMRITFFYAVILLSTSTLLAQNYHFDYYGVKNDLKSTINDVLQDNKGYIWLATESGVTRFDGLNVANFVDEDGFEIGKVNKLYKDSNGYIWIGHANGQVSFYYDSHLQKHPICDSLSAQIISFIMDKSSAPVFTCLNNLAMVFNSSIF